MGCGASIPGSKSPLSKQESIPSGSSNKNQNSTSQDDAQNVSVVFKILPSEDQARKRFEEDGTLLKNSDAGHLALRTLLDEPSSQNALGKFAARTQALDIFMCWVDIQEFKSIPTDSYRRSKALHIFHKYIQDEAILMVGVTTPLERQQYDEQLQLAKDDPSVLTPNFYDTLQAKCFKDMYHNIFLPFKQTSEYNQLQVQLKSKYNSIRLSDFEFYNKLGEGGFGFVVHCKKKSTGQHFAMKIQTKVGMLDCYRDDPWKANLEKEAFASLQHPFIVNLYYAFQTPALTLMVLGLADAGDLHTALAHAQNNRLPEDRVLFYCSEIILALDFLHQKGLIYRDLKPQNVLLTSDGHIQLVDLGGVMDEQGYWAKKARRTSKASLPLFSQDLEILSNNNQNEGENHGQEGGSPFKTAENHGTAVPGHHRNPPRRRQSIMGTIGYMAPEMVLLLSKPTKFGENMIEKQATRQRLKRHYTKAVDWWSLGITMFKLLTGHRPFEDKNVQAFVDLASTLQNVVSENLHFKEYSMLFQKINFPPYISTEAKDLITRLLDVNDTTRLGAGPNGIYDIKKHVFFSALDWDLLEQKQVEPPFKPPGIDFEDGFNPVPDLRTLLAEYGKENFLDDNPREEEQKYFEYWDFISPHTLRVEAGLAHMMEQLVMNNKARRVMGESDKVDMNRRAEKSDNTFSTKAIFGRPSGR